MNFNTPPVVKNLLIINLIFFLAKTFLPIGNEMIDLLGLHYWGADSFRIYQLVTNIFLHASFTHLFTNMFALWMFGRIIEYDFGSKRFLIYYMITGIGAGVFNMLITEIEFSSVKSAVDAFLANPTPNGFGLLASNHLTIINSDAIQGFMDAWRADPNSNNYINEAVNITHLALDKQLDTITIGASGAVFGILLAFGMTHPNDVIMLLIPPIPIKAKYFVIIYGAIELFLGVTHSFSSIAHYAHIGGMVWGFILIYYWKKTGRI